MIAYLKGQVLSIDADEVILDVGGVGYRLFMTTGCVETLKLRQALEVYVYTSVREDAIHLVAFLDQDERKLFSKLVTVSGVGTKMALSVLNTLSPYQLQLAVARKNTSLLTKIPGVGAKTAQRLILELEGYLQRCQFEQGQSTTPMPSVITTHSDTRSALQNLGYHDKLIDEALAALDNQTQDLDTSAEIRWALNWMIKKK